MWRRVVNAALNARDRQIAVIVGVLSTMALVSTSYVGLNGHHVWRQSDVLAQIYGFTGQKGMPPLGLFNGITVMFDVPIYEYLVALASRFTNTDPLVVARVVNAAWWGLFLVAGFVIAERVMRRSGVLFVCFAASSPLFQQFFSVPLPDTMSLALAFAAVALLMTTQDWRVSVLASACLSVAALIKSPIPFVLVAFFLTWFLLDRRSRSLLRTWHGRAITLVPVAVASVSAVAAEVIRKSAPGVVVTNESSDFGWYFGDWSLRWTPYYWSTMWARFLETFPFAWVGVAVLVVVIAAIALRPTDALRVFVPPVLGFLAGWLVFSNVFVIHNYYEMAVTALIMLFAAFGLQRTAELARVRIFAQRTVTA